MGQMAEGTNSISISEVESTTAYPRNQSKAHARNEKHQIDLQSPRSPQSLRDWWHELALEVEVKGEESYN